MSHPTNQQSFRSVWAARFEISTTQARIGSGTSFSENRYRFGVVCTLPIWNLVPAVRNQAQSTFQLVWLSAQGNTSLLPDDSDCWSTSILNQVIGPFSMSVPERGFSR